jgi:hypothetical protein
MFCPIRCTIVTSWRAFLSSGVVQGASDLNQFSLEVEATDFQDGNLAYAETAHYGDEEHESVGVHRGIDDPRVRVCVEEEYLGWGAAGNAVKVILLVGIDFFSLHAPRPASLKHHPLLKRFHVGTLCPFERAADEGDHCELCGAKGLESSYRGCENEILFLGTVVIHI